MNDKGASETRRAILRKMDELQHSDAGLIEMWSSLRTYIKGMARRVARRSPLRKRRP